MDAYDAFVEEELACPHRSPDLELARALLGAVIDDADAFTGRPRERAVKHRWAGLDELQPLPFPPATPRPAGTPAP